MRFILLAFLLLPIGPAAAQDSAAPARGARKPLMVQPDQVNWGPAPAMLPQGAQVAVLEGNPGESGLFTMRVSMPDGYKVPPHFHPAKERVTVVEGTFKLGMGDKFDESALAALPAGSYASMDAGMHHFAQAQGNTVVQINGVGPWKLTYVNPADNPEKATP